MDFRNISCFVSKNILSKVILKYHVSMLTFPSCVSQNPFQNNRSCESSITTIYQSKISKICIHKICKISICINHCHKASFMKSLLIAYKNHEWFHFVVRIRSPALVQFYCVWSVSFYFPLFYYFLFVESATCLYELLSAVYLPEISILIFISQKWLSVLKKFLKILGFDLVFVG